MRNRMMIGFLGFIIASVQLSSCKKEVGLNSATPLASQDVLVPDTSNFKRIQSGGYSAKGTIDYLPKSSTNVIIRHQYYTLSYNEDHEQAEWVAYELKPTYIKNNDFKRPFFIKDTKVKSGSADWRNYKNTSYDKGHLCPAGDMEFNLDAYNETFLTSNISPQVHAFNSGIWNKLEQKVRYWTVKYDGIYVVTGGVLSSRLKSIGSENVSVPQYFYKILYTNYEKKAKMIGFLIPNEKSNKPLYQFVVSVDEIEKLTGIDFFPQLNDKIEAQLESNQSYKDWSFN